jgi:primosomal protein N' (replication factor Y)
VSLLLSPEAVVDALVELRGVQKHRAVLQALQRHDGPAWIGWVYAETGASLDTLRDLEAAGLVTVVEEMVWRDPLAGREFVLDQQPNLTEDQERVWEVVAQRIGESANGESANKRISESANPQSAIPSPQSGILLHGVTGSGKTEIYLRAIGETLRRGRQAVVLVPEIALTPQTIRRFGARFPGKVTVWHSELGDGERFDVWRRVRTNHPAAQVVVGSRSALFLPFPDLGLMVIDEEHEPSYKQERTPRYHARAVALEMSRLCRAPVLLGSATPALETYFAARQGEIELLTLAKRVLGHRDDGRRTTDVSSRPSSVVSGRLVEETTELPEVRVVDMRQELRAGNRSIFSRALSSGLRHILAAGQQAILYLNRRGAATFVMCRDCGHVEACPKCATPLTYHSAGETLLCHHCNRRYPVPTLCPDCQSKRIRFFGAGTENVEEAVKLEFPGAHTLRWDRDVTGAKGSHEAILAKFIAHEADVLIGTQMIAKGLDLPLVTLVGVIAADVGLFLPDFRAGERTFQLLTQVAGRAGRSALGGQVVVQTYHPDHYAVVAASHHDYESFYRQEIAFRREQGYPPVRRLARLVYYHSKHAQAQSEATRLAGLLWAEIARLELPDTDLLGPAPCFFSMQRGDYRWQVIVRSPDPAALLRRVPVPLGWRMDIDPVDLL